MLLQNKPAKAQKALTWLRPYKDVVDSELASIQAAIDQDRAMKDGVSILDMFRNPVDRRRTILAVAAVNCQAASGAMFMIGTSILTRPIQFSTNGLQAYGTYFFEIAGVGSPFQNSCILVAVGVVAIITNTLVITRYGRRRFFLTVGLIICGFVQLFVAVVYTVKPGSKAAGKAIIALSVIYIAGYNVSGPFASANTGTGY